MIAVRGHTLDAPGAPVLLMRGQRGESDIVSRLRNRLLNSLNPSISAKLLATGLLTAGSARRANANAKSAATTSRLERRVAIQRETWIGVKEDAWANLEPIGLVTILELPGLRHGRSPNPRSADRAA